jgi:hypothetical protein
VPWVKPTLLSSAAQAVTDLRHLASHPALGFPGPALDELETEPSLHAQVTVSDVVVEGTIPRTSRADSDPLASSPCIIGSVIVTWR